MITIPFSIALIISMVFLRLFRGFGILEALKRLESRLLRPEKVPIEDLLLGAFVRLRGGLITPKIGNIYLLDLGQKIERGFGFCNNDLLDGLLPGVFPTAILLGLRTDKSRRPLPNRRIKTGFKITALASNFQKTVYKWSW